MSSRPVLTFYCLKFSYMAKHGEKLVGVRSREA